MKPVQGRFTGDEVVGQWRLYVQPAGGKKQNVSVVRGAPTTIGALTWADPFGPGDLNLTFPAITMFDKIGTDDLTWLQPLANVDLIWDGPLPDSFPDKEWRWEGYLASFDYSSGGLAVSCVGAMMQLDNYLAKPEYPAQPIPYELAISRQFLGRQDLRLRPMTIEWPYWWKTVYEEPDKAVPRYMRPAGMKAGAKWTGLVTRQTGSWDTVLSSYIQTLLQAMHTERGRWTLDLAPRRTPVLRHRDMKFAPDRETIVIDPVAPDIQVSLSTDWSQSLNVAYGQGTTLGGSAYSGMEISSDGQTTTYAPLASLRQVHPTTANPWLQTFRMRKEVNLQMQTGLDVAEARMVAGKHLARFSDPGVTGSITLGTDPTINGQPIPRSLLKAGMSVQLLGAFGRTEGLMLHVTQVSVDVAGGKTTLTVDAKYRDQLTVQEVRLRGRDALSVSRALIAGNYKPVVDDMLLPWSYADGSGYIPHGKEFSSLRLFKGMPNGTRFPYEEWTTSRPPKAPQWRNCYIRIRATNKDATKNWSTISSKEGSRLAIPIRLAQAGTIRLVQIAAYDENGKVMKVPFHVSIYGLRANPMSTPKLPKREEANHPPYKAGQYYPFWKDAWEGMRTNGTLISTEEPTATGTSQLIRGWGNGYEKAGYWPGSGAIDPTAGVVIDEPTGLLVDESTWSFDTTRYDSNFDPYEPVQKSPLAGTVYMLIYCDAQGDRDVYFAGRMFRAEPGSAV